MSAIRNLACSGHREEFTLTKGVLWDELLDKTTSSVADDARPSDFKD
jgi:hypothetical protein